jgi:hypothetical protein
VAERQSRPEDDDRRVIRVLGDRDARGVLTKDAAAYCHLLSARARREAREVGDSCKDGVEFWVRRLRPPPDDLTITGISLEGGDHARAWGRAGASSWRSSVKAACGDWVT